MIKICVILKITQMDMIVDREGISQAIVSKFILNLYKSVKKYSQTNPYFTSWLDLKWKSNRIKAFRGKKSQVFFDKGDLIIFIGKNFQKEDLVKDLFQSYLGDNCDKSKLVVENPL